MSPDRGQMSAVREPTVERPGDDLPLHGIADRLDANARRTVRHVLVQAEALRGALGARAGAGQLDAHLAGHLGVGVHQLVGFHWNRAAREEKWERTTEKMSGEIKMKVMKRRC